MPEKDLYFLALIPPEEISRPLWGFKQQVATKFLSKASLRSPPHVTLHMPFRWPDKRKDELVKRLTDLCDSSEPCSIAFNGFGAFPPKVIYVQVETNKQVVILQNDLCQLMAKKMSIHNANYQNKPFKAHLTIAFRDLKKGQFKKAWDFYKDQQYQASCNISHLTLLRHNGDRWEPELYFLLGR